MPRRRRRREPHHENLERWLVSYADFITLLFAFFTTMYAISTVDAQKMGRLVLSMQAAFDSPAAADGGAGAGPGDPGSLAPAALSGLDGVLARAGVLFGAGHSLAALRASAAQSQQPRGPERIRSELEDLVTDSGVGDRVRVARTGRGVVLSLAEAGFFDSGQDTVRPEGLPFLRRLGAYLSSLPNTVRVEGHTDDRPIRTLRFPSNWELSTARATFVVAHLVNVHGIDPRRLAAAGYGEHHPVDTNATPAGRARNRRVDIVVLSAAAMQSEPGAGDHLPD